MKKYFFIFSIVFSLFGCEGENGGNGIVYDSITNIPLDTVQYRCIETNQIEYTDSLGQWEMYGPFGECLPDCPDFTVEFFKDGYKKKTVRNPDGDIYLEKDIKHD